MTKDNDFFQKTVLKMFFFTFQYEIWVLMANNSSLWPVKIIKRVYLEVL